MVRHVRTPDGASFFGLPIGSPIGGGLIRKISQAAAAVGHHLDFSKTDHLSDNPIPADAIEKARAAGHPTVNMGLHIPISTDHEVDHKAMLDRLMPGTHMYHVSHHGRPHEHVKQDDGGWNEVAPGTGKDMGYKTSSKDLGTSLSTADSAHVTQAGKAPKKETTDEYVKRKVADDAARDAKADKVNSEKPDADDTPAEAAAFRAHQDNVPGAHKKGDPMSQQDLQNLPAGHIVQHKSGNRFISNGDGSLTGVDHLGTFAKGDYSHDAGKGRFTYSKPLDPKDMPKSRVNYHYAPKKK